MKVVVFVEYDYDDARISKTGILVPDDFDQDAAYIQCREDNTVPVKWKNQYGEGLTKRKTMLNPPVLFFNWLCEQGYEQIEVIEGY